MAKKRSTATSRVARPPDPARTKTVLAVGPHPDDVELGIGGSLIKWIGHPVVFAASGCLAVAGLLPLARVALIPESQTGPGAGE